MPKNNSRQRKDGRLAQALVRQAKASYRNCGHWHTDNGYEKCPEKEVPFNFRPESLLNV